MKFSEVARTPEGEGLYMKSVPFSKEGELRSRYRDWIVLKGGGAGGQLWAVQV